MNERIKELARQAGATDEQGNRAENVFCFTATELSGFTDLIVWECIDAIDAKEYVMGGDAEAKGMRFSINIIKKHFGVEE